MMEDVRGKKEEIPTPTTIPTPDLVFYSVQREFSRVFQHLHICFQIGLLSGRHFDVRGLSNKGFPWLPSKQ